MTGYARNGGDLLSRVMSHKSNGAPYRTQPYQTRSYCAVRMHCSEDLTLSLSKKAKGKESRCGKPAKLWKSLWRDCGKPVLRRVGPLRSGAGLRPGALGFVPVIGGHGVAWCAFAAGCAVAAVRCRARVQRRARWLAFLLREKFLDKLCKSILDWKWGKGRGCAARWCRRTRTIKPSP